MNDAAAPQTLETETCSRCGGSGNYSYCQWFGTVCFKCGGRKVTLTKRGAAAARYLRELRSKRAADVKPGDRIWISGVDCIGQAGQWLVVDTIETYEQKYKSGTGTNANLDDLPWQTMTMVRLSGKGYSVRPTDASIEAILAGTAQQFTTERGPVSTSHAPDMMVEVSPAKELKASTFAQALAYQATLTKAGTVRKAKGTKARSCPGCAQGWPVRACTITGRPVHRGPERSIDCMVGA